MNSNIINNLNPQQRAIAEAVIQKRLHLAPPEWLTEANLTLPIAGRSTCLHWAAENRQLKYVPAAILCAKNLNLHGEHGCTVLHLAAAAGCLDQVPPAELTEENLRRKNKSGQTVFHAAAASGNLRQIPARLLIADNLLLGDDHWLSPVDMAFETNHGDQIPRDVLKLYPAYSDISA